MTSALDAFRRRGARPLVIGHRGVRRPALPENTLAAFEAAHGEGAEAIELDIRACKGGELVVAHDPTLERITEGRDARAVSALSLHELSGVELSHGARVPRLVDALDLAREKGLPVNVEIKRDVPSRTAVVREAARVLAAWDPGHPILVSSFDPVMLAAFGALAPHVPRALLVPARRWHPVAARGAAALGARAVHLEQSLARPALVRALKERGMTVNVWTVNDVSRAKALAALGVDGIITDEPAKIRAALSEDTAATSPEKGS